MCQVKPKNRLIMRRPYTFRFDLIDSIYKGWTGDLSNWKSRWLGDLYKGSSYGKSLPASPFDELRTIRFTKGRGEESHAYENERCFF